MRCGIGSNPILHHVNACSLTTMSRAKKKKYPYGYPGDAPSARTRHFACHVCTKVFGTADTHTLLDAIAGEAAVLPSCERCQHVKCERCPRATPRKIEPEPDPAILKSLQEKLEEMRISGAAVAA